MLPRLGPRLLLLLQFLFVPLLLFAQTINDLVPDNYNSIPDNDSNVTFQRNQSLLNGGHLVAGTNLLLERNKSPYFVQNDLIVDRRAVLTIEPGVRVYFATGTGLIVRGKVIAVGTKNDRILLTTSTNWSRQTKLAAGSETVRFRIVDGPNSRTGRLQVRYADKWRSTCINSKNWTWNDYDTICGQLGYSGGRFFKWYDPVVVREPRLYLIEGLRCRTHTECSLGVRQLGSGACDYQPDLGIECNETLIESGPLAGHWKGLVFDRAETEPQWQRFVFDQMSVSRLEFIDIVNAGNQANASLSIRGSGPPLLHSIRVRNSASDGIRVTDGQSPISIIDSVIEHSHGYGISIGSAYGYVLVDRSTIRLNNADGIKYEYLRAELSAIDQRHQMHKICTSSIVTGQQYPLKVSFEQSHRNHLMKQCAKTFQTDSPNIFTILFKRFEITAGSTTAIHIRIYDGPGPSYRKLVDFHATNRTEIAAIATATNTVHIEIEAIAYTQAYVEFHLFATPQKFYDLKIHRTNISANNGRGLWTQQIQSQVVIEKSTIGANSYVGGVHVDGGRGDINISSSRLIGNVGAGLNVTYGGGLRNISRSNITGNGGYGIAIWLNRTGGESIVAGQETIVEWSLIANNAADGLFHGNFCTDYLALNVSVFGNRFENNSGLGLNANSCSRRQFRALTRFSIAENKFVGQGRSAVRIAPLLNALATISGNEFERNFGCVFVQNEDRVHDLTIVADVRIVYNRFIGNFGTFVVNLGVVSYAPNQFVEFKWNILRGNEVSESFGHLNPRSRVAAVVVLSSQNVRVNRNLIENPGSRFELGSHFENQSALLNCTFNWLGSDRFSYVAKRVFHLNDRYNLARIAFLPLLLDNNNFYSDHVLESNTQLSPSFLDANTIGGEIEGREELRSGEFIVVKDINIRHGGELVIGEGVRLWFHASVGMLVNGRLELPRGSVAGKVVFGLYERRVTETKAYELDDDVDDGSGVDAIIDVKETVGGNRIRLVDGRTEFEGRLEVNVDGEWGTVCSYGWDRDDAALVCHQLGAVLNANDWLLRGEATSVRQAGRFLLSNVQCDRFDRDLLKCQAERVGRDFDNAICAPVEMKCYEKSWSGIRYGPSLKRADIRNLRVEKAGLFDYATSTLKAAIQIDLMRHSINNLEIVNNSYDGLNVLYADLYSPDAVNRLDNCRFADNQGNGIVLRQLGLEITNSVLETNRFAGLKHDREITAVDQKSFLTNWFDFDRNFELYNDQMVFMTRDKFRDRHQFIVDTSIRYLIFEPKPVGFCARYEIRAIAADYVLGIQLLNPFEIGSEAELYFYDTLAVNSDRKPERLSLKTESLQFPKTSISYGFVFEYCGGGAGANETDKVIVSVVATEMKNRMKIPRVRLERTKIRNNQWAMHGLYYNVAYDRSSGSWYLRQANESIEIERSEIAGNGGGAVFLQTPVQDYGVANLSEIRWVLNGTLVTANGNGVVQESQDLRYSNNLYWLEMWNCRIEGNSAASFVIVLPYVWQYDENRTHSVQFANNTWRNNRRVRFEISGHFAVVNVTRNLWRDNKCDGDRGLFVINGMEKRLEIFENEFESNECNFVLDMLISSQSEMFGNVWAEVAYNIFRRNWPNRVETGSGTLSLKGVQAMNITRNLFDENRGRYEVVAGLKSGQIATRLNLRANWWGTSSRWEVREKIFDFDDWNSYAVAEFEPFLMSARFQARLSTDTGFEADRLLDRGDWLGGQVFGRLVLRARPQPYWIRKDLTIMPNSTLIVMPGVEMEFSENVGVLVLGRMIAQGRRRSRIVMRSVQKQARRVRRQATRTIRLCNDRRLEGARECNEHSMEGFAELLNATTKQWVPICDERFTQANAEVMCREYSDGQAGQQVLVTFGERLDLEANELRRIETWQRDVQCHGHEQRLDECPTRMAMINRQRCNEKSLFVFVRCANAGATVPNWGGIRLAPGVYEHNDIPNGHRVIGDEHESRLEYVDIENAGLLHDRKSPAILSVFRVPFIENVRVHRSVGEGVVYFAPKSNFNFSYNRIDECSGVAMKIVSLAGEGSNEIRSNFDPVRPLDLPNNMFGAMDMCDPLKEITIDRKILIYFKYTTYPVNCIKIFHNRDPMKTFVFRLLNVNLFNWAMRSDTEPDSLTLYDGNVYNRSDSQTMARICLNCGTKSDEDAAARRWFHTKRSSFSLKLFTNGADPKFGFVAEIVSMPVSATSNYGDIQHRIRNSTFSNNFREAFVYTSIGEINPIIELSTNRFSANCVRLFGNFSSCQAPIAFDLQNTPHLDFQFNLIEKNQGGLSIRADSFGLPSRLRANIEQNLFYKNRDRVCVRMEGLRALTHQEIVFARNYVSQNDAEFANTIELIRVLSFVHENYLKGNIGRHLLAVYGLSVFQTVSHNGFYENFATDSLVRSTILAGSTEQNYLLNVFDNPKNDYEIATINISRFSYFDQRQNPMKINVSQNYWSYNQSLVIASRIRDVDDDPYLFRAEFQPFLFTNRSILNGKCPPGWYPIGGTCYMYVRAPMTFEDAREFCRLDNASMPFFNRNYGELTSFLRRHTPAYEISNPVWIQNIDAINKCTAFANGRIDIAACDQINGFVCEIDPEIKLDFLSLRDDAVTLALFSLLIVLFVLVTVTIVFWHSKNRQRRIERFERRNSIRQSVNSLRSLGTSTIGSLSDFSYRKKLAQMNSKSNETLSRQSLYKKMISRDNSMESMSKSVYDDRQSFDVFEAGSTLRANNELSTPGTDIFGAAPTRTISPPELSDYQSYENIPSSLLNRNMVEFEYDTLSQQETGRPTGLAAAATSMQLNTFTPTTANSISDLMQDAAPIYQSRPPSGFQPVHRRKPRPLEIRDLPQPPTPPPVLRPIMPPVRPKSIHLIANESQGGGRRHGRRIGSDAFLSDTRAETASEELLATDAARDDDYGGGGGNTNPGFQYGKERAKSEALLETSFDYDPERPFLHASKSQPLETAM